MDRRKRHALSAEPGRPLCGNAGAGKLKFAKPGNRHRVTCRACQRELEWQDNAFLEDH